MTTYLVDMSDELAEQIQAARYNTPEGWRLLEKVADRPDAFVDSGFPCSMSRWKVEDETAPAELEGLLVEPYFEAIIDDAGRYAGNRVRNRRVREESA